jgi:PAS domain S-box-containing protein
MLCHRSIAAVIALLFTLLWSLPGITFADDGLLEQWRMEVSRGRGLVENDPQQAYMDAQLLQSSLPPDATPVDKVRVLNLLSRCEVYLALTDLAENHARLALDEAGKQRDKVGEVEALLNVVLNAMNQARVDASISATVRAMELLDGLNRPDLQGEAMLRMSMAYRRQGDMDSSITMAMQTLELAQRSENPLALTYAYQGLAMSNDYTGHDKEAREYYEKMRDQARAAHSRMLEGQAIQAWGGILSRSGDVVGGERAAREAINLFRTLRAPFALNLALFNLSEQLRIQERYPLALTLQNEVIANYEKYPSKIGLWYALKARSVIFQQMRRFVAAQNDAESAYELSKVIGFPLYQSESAKRLAELAANSGEYQHAYQHAAEAAKMAEVANSEKASTRMVELSQRYAFESRQRKINELTRSNEMQESRQRWLWTVLGGSFSMLGITAFFLFRLRRSREEISELNVGLEQRVQERTAELRQQARYLRTLIDMLPMWTWFKDTKSNYLAVNQAVAKASGRTVDEMVGKSDHDLMPPEVAQQHQAEDIEVMTSRTHRTAEHIIRGEHGPRWVETYKDVVLDDDGSVLGTVGVARDISERKEIDAARETALAEAERLARSRSEFLAQMSHELRTPLNGILGYAQILGRDKKLNERQLAGVNVIQQSGEHLLTLINDILDFAKIDAGKMELNPGDIPLEKFLRAIVSIMRVKADEKHLEFVFSMAPDSPVWIRADEKRLRQVLLNLLSNAFKFTEHGRVSLLVKYVQPGSLRFEIQDTGIGIESESLETIFQPFEQVGSKQMQLGGTGLGLPISRKFVRLMGSDIQVRSRPGLGSSFWFDLEVQSAADAGSAFTPARAVTGYTGERKTILVIDDVEENRVVAEQMLEPLGFKIIMAADGGEGLELVRTLRPDLILMEAIMPGMGGLEATRRLRRLPGLQDIPVIAVSAKASGDDETQSLSAGASAFLSKPLDLTRLLAQIGGLLKLDWIYDSDGAEPVNSGAFAVPALPELEMLHQLAQIGNMRDILQRCTYLIETDEQYRPFAEQLRTMALSYQTRAIVGFIQKHLEGKQES